MRNLNAKQSTGPNWAARQDSAAIIEANPAHVGIQAASFHQRIQMHWQTPGCKNILSAKVEY